MVVMLRRVALRYIIYGAVFSLLCLAERALGLYGLGIAFLFALFFCRERIYVALPCYFLCETLIPFSVSGLIDASGAMGVYLAAYFIHRHFKLRHGFAENTLLVLLSLVPYVARGASSYYVDIMRVGFSCLSALSFAYAAVLAVYPALVRGLRYKPTVGENFCMGILIAVIGIGIGDFEPFKVKIYYFFAAFFMLFLKGTDDVYLLPFSLSSAVGAALGMGDVLPLCTVAVAALIACGGKNLNSLFAAFFSSAAFVAAHLFIGGFDVFAVAPFCAGAFLAACIPKKALLRVPFAKRGEKGKYAMRTVVNRDREDLAERLRQVAAAFCEMKRILGEERGEESGSGTLADAVVRKVCFECAYRARCYSRFDVGKEVLRLADVAADGKAGLLDVGSALGENCRRIGYLIAAANECGAEWRKMRERRRSAELGREMIISQLGGVAELIGCLSKKVNLGLVFDYDKERLLVERLSQANIIASDVMLYEGDEGEEVTVVVRERDAKKRALGAVVSDVVGREMAAYSQKAEPSGMVGISFCRAPQYKVMYGESVYAKEKRCGDTRRAVKIGKNKIMFVLSDGMGTGKRAQRTASDVIYLIETFYRAGFDHKTIFTSAAGLMALRAREDFSALDVVVTDLETGETDFIKQGGRESYILSERGAETIEGGTLPLGIIAESEPKIERRRLKADETVIMLSDGIADTLSAEEIKAAAYDSGLHNPKAVADEIVTLARRKNGESGDDMTVIVYRTISSLGVTRQSRA